MILYIDGIFLLLVTVLGLLLIIIINYLLHNYDINFNTLFNNWWCKNITTKGAKESSKWNMHALSLEIIAYN